MSKPKSTVRPHLFVPDPDIPPDTNGRGACSVCHLISQAQDAHHTLPEPVQDARQLAAGEDR